MKTPEQQMADAAYYLTRKTRTDGPKADAEKAQAILAEIDWKTAPDASEATDSPATGTSTPATRPLEHDLDGKCVAIVVGHEPGGGTTNEREWNIYVSRYMADFLTDAGATPYVYQHKTKAYSQRMREMGEAIKQMLPKCDAAIELHYNGIDNPQANGHEYHYMGFRALAAAIRDRFQAAYDWSRPRHDDGILHNPDGRGSGFLKAAPGPAVLVEPFFRSNPKEWDFFRERQAEVARIYAAGIADFLTA